MAFLKRNMLTIVFFIAFVLAILVTFYHFYYIRHYNYQIEGDCDPDTQICYVNRDCPDEFECEETYSTKYLINANDYDSCKGSDCTEFCRENTDKCTQIMCEDGEENECSIK